MNPIIEKVARAILIARHPMTRPEDIWLDPRAVEDARAAIKATLEHVRENAKPVTWMNEHGAVTRFGHERWIEAGQKVTALYDLDALIAELG